jgi:hypothetical protein
MVELLKYRTALTLIVSSLPKWQERREDLIKFLPYITISVPPLLIKGGGNKKVIN